LRAICISALPAVFLEGALGVGMLSGCGITILTGAVFWGFLAEVLFLATVGFVVSDFDPVDFAVIFFLGFDPLFSFVFAIIQEFSVNPQKYKQIMDCPHEILFINLFYQKYLVF
jgi:hypothetical protein